MTYLSTYCHNELLPIAEELKTLGISVIALPASDVCMMARSDDGACCYAYSLLYEMIIAQEISGVGFVPSSTCLQQESTQFTPQTTFKTCLHSQVS